MTVPHPLRQIPITTRTACVIARFIVYLFAQLARSPKAVVRSVNVDAQHPRPNWWARKSPSLSTSDRESFGSHTLAHQPAPRTR